MRNLLFILAFLPSICFGQIVLSQPGVTIAGGGSSAAPATSGTFILKGNGSGGTTPATAGTDFTVPTTPTFTGQILTTLTTEQMRLRYDASNYATFTVTSNGALIVTSVGVANVVVFGSPFQGTYRSSGAGVSNFEIGAGTSGSDIGNATSTLGGANANSRVNFSGNTSTTLGANNNYAAQYFGVSPCTEAASGTHAVIANLGVRPITVTNGVATVTRTATVYIEGASSATVTDANYALYVAAGAARFNGGEITTGISVVSGSNAKAGTFTLVSGMASVANTSVTANSVIVATVKTASGTVGAIYYPAVIPGSLFAVQGAATDNSTYNYVILEVQ